MRFLSFPWIPMKPAGFMNYAQRKGGEKRAGGKEFTFPAIILFCFPFSRDPVFRRNLRKPGVWDWIADTDWHHPISGASLKTGLLMKTLFPSIAAGLQGTVPCMDAAGGERPGLPNHPMQLPFPVGTPPDCPSLRNSRCSVIITGRRTLFSPSEEEYSGGPSPSWSCL